MSKYSDLPKRVLQNIYKVEKKIVTYPVSDKFKKLREKYDDFRENRELVVVDKYGNKYYQYYSHHGLPTRRVVINFQKSFNKWDDDPFMMSWLQKRRLVPPTQEELEKMYIENEEFQRRGLEWDRKEQAMIDEWKRKQKEAIESEKKETKAIGEGETFTPGVWDRNKEILNSKNALVEVKEEKSLIEGASTIPGKYIMDFKEEDERWIEKKRQEALQPYLELAKKVDWSQYTIEKMPERNQAYMQKKKEELDSQKKQLTNLGKRMIEKKEAYQRYGKFRERFKDVFDNNDFSYS